MLPTAQRDDRLGQGRQRPRSNVTARSACLGHQRVRSTSVPRDGGEERLPTDELTMPGTGQAFGWAKRQNVQSSLKIADARIGSSTLHGNVASKIAARDVGHVPFERGKDSGGGCKMA